MNEYQLCTHEFEPVYDKNSSILILGSFPSVKSRQTQFYYGHPHNRFWNIMAQIMREAVPQTIPQKKAFLLSHGIALWDVIAQCEIKGSSDASIRNVIPTDLHVILDEAPICLICCNGNTAYRLFRKYQGKTCGLEAVCLPSTSPANAAWSFERLTAAWGEVLNGVETSGTAYS